MCTCEFCQVKYEQWKKNPTCFVAMTGYTMERFGELLPSFKEAHDQYLSRYQMNGKRRKGMHSFMLYTNPQDPRIYPALPYKS
jgi:hypothetical protein